MKITTGRQLLEWLQKQTSEVLDNKILACGEDFPIHIAEIFPSVLKEDIYQGDECEGTESEMTDEYGNVEEMKSLCEKTFDKGGIIIYI